MEQDNLLTSLKFLMPLIVKLDSHFVVSFVRTLIKLVVNIWKIKTLKNDQIEYCLELILRYGDF